jgi:Xaa-Pro aminopeptidase
MDHEDRMGRLRERVSDLDIAGLLITDLMNVRYLTGFSGTSGHLLVTPNEAIFYSDGRYAARAASLVRGAEISIYENRLTELLGPRLSDLDITRLGFEAASVTVAGRDDLANKLPGVELVSTSSVVEDMRRVKDPEELRLLRKAVELGDETFAWVLERLQPGVSEREVALELEMHMRRSGADEVAFDPIVGGGPLSAHIHHTPSDRAFEKGDLVLLDFGARVDGYCSDLTRTVVLGHASDEQHQIYTLVQQAQAAGIWALQAGKACAEVDSAARSVIEKAGRGKEFGHGLGHGVGLDIHEAPWLKKISEENLRAGDVVTVEPGVYVRERGGVRIEDCVLVTAEGAEILGSAPRDELIEL